MDAPVAFFYSDKDFYFRPLTSADLAGRWPAWFNDGDVTRFTSMGYYPNTPESQQKYYDRLVGSTTDVVLAIVDSATHKHVGNVGLHQIDPVHRTAYLGIVLGEKAAWGRGIGARSWRAITDYGFTVLNLHKICAKIADGNEASLKCALKAGYTVEGRQRAQMYKNGEYRDLVYVGLLRDDWTK